MARREVVHVTVPVVVTVQELQIGGEARFDYTATFTGVSVAHSINGGFKTAAQARVAGRRAAHAWAKLKLMLPLR